MERLTSNKDRIELDDGYVARIYKKGFRFYDSDRRYVGSAVWLSRSGYSHQVIALAYNWYEEGRSRAIPAEMLERFWATVQEEIIAQHVSVIESSPAYQHVTWEEMDKKEQQRLLEVTLKKEQCDAFTKRKSDFPGEYTLLEDDGSVFRERHFWNRIPARKGEEKLILDEDFSWQQSALRVGEDMDTWEE